MLIKIEMGKISFWSQDIPVTGKQREVLNETILIKGQSYQYYADTIGNPHVVIPLPQISKEIACELGPLIENHQNFPKKTNVQFLKVIDRKNIQIEIWERGAGYTLASGTSSCSAVAVAKKMGLIDNEVTVHMQGGTLNIAITDDYQITMIGQVTKIGNMDISTEALAFKLKGI
eukprot:TRINITY_DN9180_c0_g1_i1.p1 TRINITY_DN9180_c0_g1~~TRINITY_DN9180_c0_g1_i1.p1  ORF type:complete len:174 (+),score=27.41 TRINITY_DN9180_c0_g1_i1:411-932(+)